MSSSESSDEPVVTENGLQGGDDNGTVLFDLNSKKPQHFPEKPTSISAAEAKQLLGEASSVDPNVDRLVELRVYRRRWAVLLTVALLNNSNTMSWIAFAPVANHADAFYGAGSANWFSLVYLLCTIPVGIVAMWMGRIFGLRTAIWIAAWANGIGALIRLGSSFLQPDLRFPIGITGQAVASVAYPFIMFLPTRVAGAWFPDSQRGLATTIGAMSNPLGVLFANLISPQLVKDPSHVVYLNALTLTVSALATVMAVVAVDRSQPKIAPTLSASMEQSEFLPGVKKCMTSRSYMLLFLVMGGGIGMFNCLYTIMQQLLCPKGYGNTFAGLCAVLMIVGGVFGATVSGMFVDRTKKYVPTYKVSFAFAVIAGIIFVQLALHENLQIPIIAMCFVFGFMGLATYPVGLELSAECSYPVSETTSTGLIVLSGQVQSTIFILVMTKLSSALKPEDEHMQVCKVAGVAEQQVEPRDMTLPVVVFSGIAVALAVVLLVFFKPKLRRLLVDRSAIDMRTLKAKQIDGDQGGKIVAVDDVAIKHAIEDKEA